MAVQHEELSRSGIITFYVVTFLLLAGGFLLVLHNIYQAGEDAFREEWFESIRPFDSAAAQETVAEELEKTRPDLSGVERNIESLKRVAQLQKKYREETAGKKEDLMKRHKFLGFWSYSEPK